MRLIIKVKVLSPNALIARQPEPGERAALYSFIHSTFISYSEIQLRAAEVHNKIKQDIGQYRPL